MCGAAITARIRFVSARIITGMIVCKWLDFGKIMTRIDSKHKSEMLSLVKGDSDNRNLNRTAFISTDFIWNKMNNWKVGICEYWIRTSIIKFQGVRLQK